MRSKHSESQRLAWRSLLIALAIALGASLLGLVELRSRLYTNELLARNSAERSLNLLLQASRQLRRRHPEGPGHQEIPLPSPLVEGEEYMETLNSQSELRERIRGVAVYTDSGQALLRWGTAPETNPFASLLDRKTQRDSRRLRDGFRSFLPPQEGVRPERTRLYRLDQGENSIAVLQAFPLMANRRSMGQPPGERIPPALQYLYWDLAETRLFTQQRLAKIVWLGWVLASFAVSLFVRRTILRNRQYRQTLRSQEELVALGSAAATLAHEIKNPLGAISLQTDILARSTGESESEQIQAIRSEIGRIRELVNRIGDYLRKTEGDRIELDLKDLVQEVLARQPSSKEIHIDTDPGGLPVLAMREKLSSIIENLLQNALESGSPPQKIGLRLVRSGEQALLELSDRGCGLPEGMDSERLFMPFFTTKTQGFGLGLALARRFARELGGELSLEGRSTGGMLARLSIPLSRGATEKKGTDNDRSRP